MIDYTAMAFAILSAMFWLKGAQMENRSPVTWVALSVGVSGVVMIGLHGGWQAVLLSQIALVIVITVYRTLTEKPRG
jgi:drug/metabolite transporter (DMT)-like permease